MSENDFILLNTRSRQLLRPICYGTSTHNLSLNAEAETKAKDKFKAFYFKLVPFVSS